MKTYESTEKKTKVNQLPPWRTVFKKLIKQSLR